MKSILVFLALLAPSSVTAQEASEIVNQSVHQALDVLRNPELQGTEHRQERHKRLRSISDEIFNWSSMAQRSLGAPWRTLEPSKRARFTEVFSEILSEHYLKQIDRFQGGEQLALVGADRTPEGVQVKMTLTTKSKETIPIHFFVGDDKRVYDVSIEGVSIVSHFRGSFARFLVNRSFEDLMQQLEAKLRSVEAGRG